METRMPSALTFFSVPPHFYGNTDSIVVRFHSWIFIQSEESSDANSKLFKEDDDEAMYKNPCEIRLCD